MRVFGINRSLFKLDITVSGVGPARTNPQGKEPVMLTGGPECSKYILQEDFFFQNDMIRRCNNDAGFGIPCQDPVICIGDTGDIPGIWSFTKDL